MHGTTPRGRRAMATTAALALAALCAPSAAQAHAPAHARGSSILCVGSAEVTYSPGLTHTRSQVDHGVDYRYRPCLVRNQRGITSGAFQAVSQQFEDCADLVASTEPYDYTMPIKWNDGTMSFADVTVRGVADYPFPAFELSGEVIDGHFADNDFRMNLYFHNNTAELSECDSPEGLTSLSGTLVLSLTPPRR